VSCGVIVFPGSNCDHDALRAVERLTGRPAKALWHKDRDLAGSDRVILPGGFSYGDYLRAGALARFSPIMEEVIRFAERGGPVLGICNGFQILCEAGLLPGVLTRNASLQFACRDVHVRLESADSVLSHGLTRGRVLRLPIAHADGNYTLEASALAQVEDSGQVLLRYCEPSGEVTAGANPNGSLRNIAGLRNPRGNVVGLMPHPERALEPLLPSLDGEPLLRAFLS
jgi:phosphoribosylformylglycinamidine synthase subunit PurQ / glutaminase